MNLEILRPIAPFLILLIVSVIFYFIQMEPPFKKIGGILIGIIAVILLLPLLGINIY